MSIHGSNTSLSLSEINAVFSATSMSNLRGDAWYIGDAIPIKTVENFTQPGKYTYVCPMSLGVINFDFSGGGGGGGGADRGQGHDGYPGARITGNYSFHPGDTITVYVGGGGTSGQGLLGNALGGAAGGVGIYAGGSGGNSGPTPYSGAGGGGGGASAIIINSLPYAIAGGGGGGGGGGRDSDGADAIDLRAPTSAGTTGASHLTNGGGAGGGGGGNFGGLGGAVQSTDLGGFSGSSGTNLLPPGWTATLYNNNGMGASSQNNDQTSGSSGYVKFIVSPNSLVTGTFASSNLKFSDFFNKNIVSPATTGTQTYTTNGTYTFQVPVFANTLTIQIWGAGGGGGGLSSGMSGEDTIVTVLGTQILIASGGNGGAAGIGQGFGVGGLGGIPTGGNSVGSLSGKNGKSFGVEGNSAGGDSPSGGTGGSSALTTTAGVVYNGGAGNAPGGGGGGFYNRDTNTNPTYYGGGGGGGGAYVLLGPLDPTVYTSGTTFSIYVGKGGDGGLLNTSQVGGAGADGKITLTWT